MKATLKDKANIEVHEVILDWTDGTPKVIKDKVISKDKEENNADKRSL